jgi:hypothetical protein
MKHFAYALVLLLSSISMNGFSQSQHVAKPKLFANNPDRISLQESDFSSLFTASEGQSVNLNFSNLPLSGTVASNVFKYNNALQTVIVRLNSLDNTILSISKRLDASRNTEYIGRIVNMKYFDGYELKKDVTGVYQLNKIETDKVVQPCGQQL